MTNRLTAETLAARIRDQFPADPQRVGGYYRCGYWGRCYTVLAQGTREIVVAWEDGRISRHCTPWDARRDRVIFQPTAA